MPYSTNIYAPERLADVKYASYLYTTELADLLTGLEDTLTDDNDEPLPDPDPEIVAEIKYLNEILDEISSYADDSDVTLIADDHFTEYAQELADDIGATDRNASWPNTFIDWERAADALREDYTSITINGKEYWYR